MTAAAYLMVVVVGKRHELRMPAAVFQRLVDLLMLLSGCSMLLAAF